jgi:hypothetical protein
MQDLIERFRTWASDQADVRSALIVGSLARADEPPDDMADLDLVVIVKDPFIYLSDTAWLRHFGEPCVTFVESTAVGLNPASARSFGNRVIMFFLRRVRLLPGVGLLAFQPDIRLPSPSQPRQRKPRNAVFFH